MTKWVITESDNIQDLFLNGYILPRENNQGNSEQHSDQALLCREMIEKYGDNFINHIKGNFIIILPIEGGFRVFSDRFAIRKFFYWVDGDRFIVSNSIKEITSRVKTQLSVQSMAIYGLTYHFTGGKTAFEGIYHNQPGEYIEYSKQATFTIKKYWHAGDLLSCVKDDITIQQISQNLVNVVKSTLPSQKVSLSLTGGADTRNLLSVLLSLGVNPHLYTYGNPHSADCVVASSIARGLRLSHDIHDIRMTPELFEEKAREIIHFGGGLASIHRVHRIIAIEREAEYAKYMYLGTLGGEFIRGVSEDNYIIPSLVFNNWQKSMLSKNNIVALLDSKRIRAENVDIDDLLRYLAAEPFMNGDVVWRKFHSLSHITAHLHDAQDVNLYREYMDEVYTPFLDIDYLELIFSSRYTFNNKEEVKNKYLRRIENPIYCSQFLETTFKPLTKYKYVGEHKPSEVLTNKYSAAILKAIRQKITKPKPANFPLGVWMEQFVEMNLPLCKDNEAINAVFDIDALMVDYRNERHFPAESYWLKYTNPIMMRFIAEELH